MSESHEKSALVALVKVLTRHGVEFMVIGGQAAIIHGSPLLSYDYDFCYLRTAENLERLARALQELRPTLRGAPKDLPFRIDRESLALGSNYTFDTQFGSVDFLGWVEPFGTYEALLPRSVMEKLGDLEVRVIGLDDLITIKRHLARPKDRAALFQLEEIKRLKAEQK